MGATVLNFLWKAGRQNSLFWIWLKNDLQIDWSFLQCFFAFVKQFADSALHNEQFWFE